MWNDHIILWKPQFHTWNMLQVINSHNCMWIYIEACVFLDILHMKYHISQTWPLGAQFVFYFLSMPVAFWTSFFLHITRRVQVSHLCSKLNILRGFWGSVVWPDVVLQNSSSVGLWGGLCWASWTSCLHAATKTPSPESVTPHFAHPCETILSQYHRSLIVGDKLYNARNYRLACKC